MDFGMPFLLENANIADAVMLCHELGLQFVELNMSFPTCLLERLDVQELYHLKRQYGVFFTLHVEEDCNPFAFNTIVRRAWQNSLRQCLRLAQVIEAPIINMHLPNSIYITLPDRRVCLNESYFQDYMEAVQELRTLAEDELSGSGTRLAIENTSGFPPYQQKALEWLQESPVIGLTLDIGHSHAIGDKDIPFYQRMNKLIHMHVHDAKGTSNHLALGDGDIDLQQRLDWARRSGARCVLETKTINALSKSVAWLRSAGLMDES